MARGELDRPSLAAYTAAVITSVSSASSREELNGLIEGYFDELILPQGPTARQVLGYLDELAEGGATLQGLESAWTDLELLIAFLESLPASRALDDLQPWEFSTFLFDFLSKEVYDAGATQPQRKRELLSTVVGFLAYLFRYSLLPTPGHAEEALRRIFRAGSPRRLPRPELSADEVVGYLTGRSTGVAHRITGADLWLTLVRDEDLDGEWKVLLLQLQNSTAPDADRKLAAAKRLESIESQDEVTAREFLGTQAPSRELLDRARRFVKRDPWPKTPESA